MKVQIARDDLSREQSSEEALSSSIRSHSFSNISSNIVVVVVTHSHLHTYIHICFLQLMPRALELIDIATLPLLSRVNYLGVPLQKQRSA